MIQLLREGEGGEGEGLLRGGEGRGRGGKEEEGEGSEGRGRGGGRGLSPNCTSNDALDCIVHLGLYFNSYRCQLHSMSHDFSIRK